MNSEDKKIDDNYIIAIHDRLENPPSWMWDGLCSKENVFASYDPEDVSSSLCSRCPVRQKCLSWGEEHNISYGVFGGRDFAQ